MALLDDISAHLQTQGITGPIHKGFYPDQPDDLVSLFEYAGEPMELTMSDNDPVLERPGLQVRVRSKTYPTGRTKIGEIVAILHGLANKTLSGTRYLLIKANQSPESMGLDQNNRSEFVVNFSVLKER